MKSYPITGRQIILINLIGLIGFIMFLSGCGKFEANNTTGTVACGHAVGETTTTCSSGKCVQCITVEWTQ